MVRSYLRHAPTQAFGLIASATSNALLDADAKVAFVPALEDVLVWDVKRGALLSSWHEVGHRSKVTAIARSTANPDTFAVGYEDGSIRLWSAHTATTTITLNGHKKAVTSLTFDSQGLRLASASLDTDVILWDVVAETGLFRLRGHRDAVTAVAFIQTPAAVHSSAPSSSNTAANATAPGYLISASKDGLVKLWDLSLQHCIETVVPGRGEIWSLAVSQQIPLLSSTGNDSTKTSEGEGQEQDDLRDGVGGALILTGSSEGEMRVWEISAEALINGLSTLKSDQQIAAGGDTPVDASHKLLMPRGSVPLTGNHRVSQIQFCGGSAPAARGSATGSSTAAGPSYIAVSSTDKAVQIFRLRTTDEIAKKLARRKRRMKEKAEKKKGKQGDSGSAVAAIGEEEDDATGSDQVTWADRIEAYTSVRPTAGRLRSFSAVVPDTTHSNKVGLSLLCALSTNALEVHNVPPPPRSKAEKAEPIEPVLASGLDLPGHRADVRAIALSSDDSLLATACGAGQLKVWNVLTGRCVRTLPCSYALSVAWLPGDQHVLVGCKDGTLRSFDVRAGIAIETIQAHEGPLWSLAMQPDGLSCVSASADKDVKFWEFEMKVEDESGSDGEDVDEDDDEDEGQEDQQAEPRPAKAKAPPQLSLVHVRTLKMTDDVLCARFSPNGKLLALSLLDNTVKVFYADTLKFFLSLYGHKLPVLSLDISQDNRLCVTVSADKNVKIWGLDFGDCHKSIFAHDESIMGVCFEHGRQGGGLFGGREGDSHHFWTVGKDGMLKHWDGDRFELIQQLEGHHGEVWAVTPGHRGQLVVTAGADRSIRTWEKTDEPLFLEEERERELERAYQSAGNPTAARDEGHAIGSLAEGADPAASSAAQGPESTSVSKATAETLMAGERLIEALDTADADLAARRLASKTNSAPPPFHALIVAAFEAESAAAGSRVRSAPSEETISTERYVLKTVEKIVPAQLEDALLVLPFERVLSLLRYLDFWARKEWNISLVARILFFLLRTHHAQIVSNRIMRPTLVSLRSHLRNALARQKTTIGYNLAALRHVRAQHVAMKTSELYEREGLDMDEEEVRRRLEAGGRGRGGKGKRKVLVG